MTADTRLAALDPARGALLMIDVQRSFADPALLGAYGMDAGVSAALAAAIDRCSDLVDHARAAGVPIYWIELATEPNTPWRASRWLRTGDLDAPLDPEEPCVVGTPGAQWYRIGPRAHETRIRKRAYSGFLGTDLATRLRSDSIRWVTVAGLTTECCIAATATDALQLGWPVVLAEDATAAYEARLHEAAIEQLALNVAAISSVDAVASLWRCGTGAEGAA
ncbi:MAG: cysteine hydrolase [Microbacterium sp.]|uniref:cysteine hydrolase family protein n=1 Tax=Microbacterium sp. TaxID=51671 RepID=UPI000DB1FF8B|nr:cysteine hydrolase [Microbacterium sp.]PZU40353.1 MAG: cysteine hydrolase [Microbacterium sp.]